MIRGAVTVAREEGKGKNRVSIRDFHSFRVTWVTLALSAGVPLELVQKVTGHKTAEIVLKHYFQPGREAFRNALQKAFDPCFSTVAPRQLPASTVPAAADELTAAINDPESGLTKKAREHLLALAARVTT